MHYEIIISAPAEKVYRTMLDEEKYKIWTAVFHPTSHYKGSWEKGAKIQFLGLDEQGVAGGMVSRINENIPNQFISIEHLGLVQGDTEITSGPEVAEWTGALENYTFTEKQGETVLAIDVDTNQEYEAHFSETWPKALQKIKEMSEAGS
nr:SRPBCC domain-containing protein [Pontibacter sp. HSC-36F09]